MAFKKEAAKATATKAPKETAKGGEQWFNTGKRGEQKSEEIQEAMEKGHVLRFWLPAEKSAKVTFLDSEGFYFYEHNLFLRGKWNNHFTCRKDFDNCPLCDAGDTPSYVCAFTVIDHSKYISKKSKKEIKNTRKLMVLKPRAFNKLKKRRDGDKLKGDLKYALFELSRTSSDECSTGEDFDFIKRLKPDELAKLCPADLKGDERKVWGKPVDYVTEFAPKSADALSRLAGAAPAVGSRADVAGESELTGSGSSDDLDGLL